MALTPFEITYGHPAPAMTSSLQTDPIAELDDRCLFNAIQWLQLIHKTIWPKLRMTYEAAFVPALHRFRPEDWVFIQRYHPKSLRPRWKELYMVVLTTPTALKVDGIASWAHYSHARPAGPFTLQEDYRRDLGGIQTLNVKLKRRS